MLTRDILHNKPATTALLVMVVTELLSGCASTNTFPGQSHYPRPLSTVSLTQHGLSLAVWLEDQCENQETDQQRVTMLEALHDGLAVPTEMLFAISVVTVVGTIWSLYDRVTLPTGEPLHNRPQMVLDYVKPYRAGPQQLTHSKAHGAGLPISWLGCLSAYEDG